MVTLENLLEIEAIRELKGDYWWYVDNKDWKALREIVTDDYQWYFEGKLLYKNGDEFLEMVKGTLEGVITAHQGHQYKVEITGPTTAKGRWMLNDTLRSKEMEIRDHGFGYYLEEYEKSKDGRWRIKSSDLRYFIKENE